VLGQTNDPARAGSAVYGKQLAVSIF